jgi:hypothetical protein
MGRPLNKRNFAEAGIMVQFVDAGGANVDGIIYKQTGSKTFICADNDSGESQYECRLVSKVPDTAGEMAIVLDSGIYVTKISGRKLTASDGNTYRWDISGGGDDKAGGYYDLTDE